MTYKRGDILKGNVTGLPAVVTGFDPDIESCWRVEYLTDEYRAGRSDKGWFRVWDGREAEVECYTKPLTEEERVNLVKILLREAANG